MKSIVSLFVAAGIAITGATVWAADEKKETKRVCVDQKDKEGKVVKNKDGSNKQTCKDVVVHKKLEGKEVPNQKK